MNKKKIGINTLFCVPGKVGGSEIFLRQLLEGLAKERKNKYLYFIFVNNENMDTFGAFPRNFKIVHCPINASVKWLRLFWEQIILPVQCLLLRIDLLHSPGYTSPLITSCKKITTIFDLNYHFHPEDFTRFQLFIYRVLMPLVARFSDKILVHTNTAKKEVADLFKISKKKIVVVYPGVSNKFLLRYSKEEIKSVLSMYDVKQPYILSNAVSHPHKNLASLLLAYKDLVDKYRIKHTLVLLGFPGRDQERLEKIIKKKGLGGRVQFTGWVDPEKVPYFYRGASVFVFPSLYEGFGLPLVESMASETPLVASKYSCIPEVVRDGGLLVDSRSPLQLAEGILVLMRNAKLRKRLVGNGLERAGDFSWTDFAHGVISAYSKTILDK